MSGHQDKGTASSGQRKSSNLKEEAQRQFGLNTKLHGLIILYLVVIRKTELHMIVYLQFSGFQALPPSLGMKMM